MQAFLDGKPVSAVNSTFAAAVAAVLLVANEQKRLIIEVLADGAPVSDACLNDPNNAKVLAARLEFKSEPQALLVATTLENAADVLSETRAQQLSAAEQLQLGEHKTAFEQLGPVLETWAAVQSAVSDSAAVLHVDVDAMGHSAGIELKPLIMDLSSHLGGLKVAINARDWSSAADTLAYDLDTQCERWGIALRKLSASLTKAGAGGGG